MSVASRGIRKRKLLCVRCKQPRIDGDRHPHFCDNCLEAKAEYIPTPKEIEEALVQIRAERIEIIRSQGQLDGNGRDGQGVFVPRVYKHHGNGGRKGRVIQ